MKIALIHAPFKHHLFSENLKVVDENFIMPPPVILAYVAAIIERAGHKVLLIDAHSLKKRPETVAQEIKSFEAELIGVRLDVYNFHTSLDYLRDVLEYAPLPVIAGGPALDLYPREALTHPELSWGLVGEALKSLPKFLEAYKDGAATDALKEVSGLVWRNGEEIVVNPLTEPLAEFDDYPFPARHLLNNSLYSSFVSQRRNFTIALASRGCPYKCTFCDIAPLHYQTRSPESVFEEIKECYHRFGVREIDFFDAVFMHDRERSLELFELLERENLDIDWSCRNRVDLVDDELLRRASRAGCRMINLGIESGNPEILRNIKKGILPNQTQTAVELCKRNNIRVLGFIMIGNPGETQSTINETIEFAKHLELDYVQICRTIAKPRSALYKQAVQSLGYDYFSKFILGEMPERRLPMPWSLMSQKDVEQALKKAYMEFYMRPKFIAHTLYHARSTEEISRYVRVGIKMLRGLFYSDIKL